MKKTFFFWYFLLSVLPLSADVFYPDSSFWRTVELHDWDTITLNSAALYKFSQTTDTVRNVVIKCTSPRSTDTVFSSVDITGLNVKDFKLTTTARCNVRLQGDAVFSGTSKISPVGKTFIDVDTLPELWPSGDVYIERGKIYNINGGRLYIGMHKSGNIKIDHIAQHNTQQVYLYDGVVSSVYLIRERRLTMYGGYLKRMYWTGSTESYRNDTIIVVNGGEVETIDKNGNQVAVINGGAVGLLNMGGNGHLGNVYLNGGEFRTTLGAGSVKWHNPNKGEVSPVDTLFFDQHAIVGYTHKGLEFKNKNGVLALDDIHSLTSITSDIPMICVYENRTLGEKTQRVKTVATKGKYTYNITKADSLLVWDFLSIYESKKCIIHYQVADGVAPSDTTYQEGLVKHFTTLPTRTDYDFVGWYADSTYTIRVDSLDEWSRGDTTLWAKWDSIPERLAYETFGIRLANQEDLRTRHSEQQQFAISDAIPERPFYDFHGWHADSITGPIVTHTTNTPLVDMKFHILYGDFTRELPSLSVMIVQGNCLAIRNPDGLSEIETAHYTWVYQDTITVNGVDSIISDTLPSHKMFVEVGNPIPPGRYTAIVRFDDELPLYVTRHFFAAEIPSPAPKTQTIFHIGSYALEVDEEGRKYLIMP